MKLEDQHHIEVDAVYSTSIDGDGADLYITAECRRCPWIAGDPRRPDRTRRGTRRGLPRGLPRMNRHAETDEETT